MRDIEFRGKSEMSIDELNDLHFEHEDGWFYGNLVMYGSTPYIVGDFVEVDQEYTVNEFWVSVHSESVGQYIGLKDINDKKIYEGNIVRYKDYDGMIRTGVVVFKDGSFAIESPIITSYRLMDYEIEVIGDGFTD